MFQGTTPRKLLALVGACALLALWPARAQAQINCDTAGAGALQAAIDSGQYLIEFTGTCNESLGLHRDNIHLRGTNADPALNVINGGATVTVAQDIVFENLKIQGNSFNIVNGAHAFVRDSIIENTNFGIFIGRNAAANFDRNTIGPALVDDGSVSCTPICVGDNSFLHMRNNIVNGATNDPRSGAAVGVFRSSSLLLRGGNTITNSGTQPAIGLWHQSEGRQDNNSGLGTDQISGGVEVFQMSVFDTRQAVITGDSTVAFHSVMRVGNVLSSDPSLIQINGKIRLSQDSALRVDSPLVTINGDVTCADGESSAVGSFAGTGKNLCSGFSSVHSDFNGDGKADVLWRNGTTGATVIWLMDGATRLAGGGIGRPPLAWQIDKVEDYNGDGKADILWRNTSTGKALVWLMDGFTRLDAKSIGGASTDWQIQP
jgi:hypothetical protein